MFTSPTRSLATPLRLLLSKLPKRPPSDVMAITLNAARLAGKLPQDWCFLDNRHVKVVVSDLPLEIHIGWQGTRFIALSSHAMADVTFTASSQDFLQLLRRQEDPDTLFFQRRLQIEGDTELGLTLKNLLDSVELPAWMTTTAH